MRKRTSAFQNCQILV
jgi:hypothetical protein